MPQESLKIAKHDGIWCLESTSVDIQEPKRYRYLYPIATIDVVEGYRGRIEVGDPVSHIRGERYSTHEGKIVLLVQDSAKPIFFSATEIKPPKAREGTETRWYRGRWQKRARGKYRESDWKDVPTK